MLLRSQRGRRDRHPPLMGADRFGRPAGAEAPVGSAPGGEPPTSPQQRPRPVSKARAAAQVRPAATRA